MLLLDVLVLLLDDGRIRIRIRDAPNLTDPDTATLAVCYTLQVFLLFHLFFSVLILSLLVFLPMFFEFFIVLSVT